MDILSSATAARLARGIFRECASREDDRHLVVRVIGVEDDKKIALGSFRHAPWQLAYHAAVAARTTGHLVVFDEARISEELALSTGKLAPVAYEAAGLPIVSENEVLAAIGLVTTGQLPIERVLAVACIVLRAEDYV